MKAMILAAGLGTRLKPWTNFHPKALALVNGKSLLQRNIEYLQKHGITEVIINVHHFTHQIISAINDNNGWGSQITISDETEKVLETGGGLKKASWYFENEEDFVVMNADVLTDMNLSGMIAKHIDKKSIATLAVSNRETSRYFLFNENSELVGWKNVKTGEEKISKISEIMNSCAFSGIQILNKKIFNYLLVEDKFSLVEVYLEAAKHEKIMAFNHSGSIFIDVGKPGSVEKAERLF